MVFGSVFGLWDVGFDSADHVDGGSFAAMLRGVAGFGGEDSEIINATDFSTSRLFGFHDAPSFAGSLLEICYGSMDILFLPRRTLFLEGSSNPGIFA